jgi:NADH-quinone oxidoreductase subunit I
LLELTPQFGSDQPAGAAATPAAATGAAPQAAAAPATASREDEIHVEAQVDQAVMDKLVAEGMPERVARAKAKAHYVRSERARIKAEQGAS